MWRIIAGIVGLLGYVAVRVWLAAATAPEHDPRVAACYSDGAAETRIAACSELAADPEQIDANRALALATIGDQIVRDDPIAAIEKYNQAIRLAPETLSHRTSLASALLSAGDLDGADAAIQQAAAISMDAYNVRWLRSELAFQRGNYADAARQYGALIDELPALDAHMRSSARSIGAKAEPLSRPANRCSTTSPRCASGVQSHSSTPAIAQAPSVSATRRSPSSLKLCSN